MSTVDLDMALDARIKSNRKSAARGRGRGGGDLGPSRREKFRAVNRAAPYAVSKASEAAWGHLMFSHIETGTKLYISNLDYGVSDEDIKELFAEVGELKRYSINYDILGRSKGTAEVVFAQRQDAVTAIRKYHDVKLDGKPMHIELIGTSISIPVAVTGAFANSTFAPPRGVSNRAFGDRGRGSSRGRDRGNKISADDLDAELDKYHADAMQET